MYFYFIRPAISDVKGLMAEKAQYTMVLEKSQELTAKRDEILTKYNSIPEDEIEKINKIIPETYESEIFLNTINNLASPSGMKIKNIKDNGVAPTDRSAVVVTDSTQELPYKINMMTITLNGGYAQLLKFLNDLETSLHLVDVKSVTLRSASKDSKSSLDTYDFEVNLAAYSLK